MECDCCHEFFEKAKGHQCLCPYCDKLHPMCANCYDFHKSKGHIKDTKWKKEELHPEITQKWR